MGKSSLHSPRNPKERALRNPQSQWRVCSWANHRTGDRAAARHVVFPEGKLVLNPLGNVTTKKRIGQICYFHGKINYFDWAMASIANC